jgi:hypothetical protein
MGAMEVAVPGVGQNLNPPEGGFKTFISRFSTQNLQKISRITQKNDTHTDWIGQKMTKQKRVPLPLPSGMP